MKSFLLWPAVVGVGMLATAAMSAPISNTKTVTAEDSAIVQVQGGRCARYWQGCVNGDSRYCRKYRRECR